MRADDAVERRDHIGIAVVDRRDLGVDLGLLQIGLRVVAVGRGGIERRLRDRLPLHQIRLALEIGFGLLQRCLRTGLGRLRLFELELVGVGLDREQRGAFLDESAVLVIDRLQKALHARDQIDGLDRRGVAGGIEKTRDGALHRQARLRPSAAAAAQNYFVRRHLTRRTPMMAKATREALAARARAASVQSAACWRTRRLHFRASIDFVLERLVNQQSALAIP